jgi:type IV pilus assembly protein PilP
MKGRVAPLPEITAFPVVAYETETLTQPFAPGKIVTLEAVADKTAPDRSRPKQPLEIFPIEDLKVVGIIMAGSRTVCPDPDAGAEQAQACARG